MQVVEGNHKGTPLTLWHSRKQREREKKQEDRATKERKGELEEESRVPRGPSKECPQCPASNSAQFPKNCGTSQLQHSLTTKHLMHVLSGTIQMQIITGNNQQKHSYDAVTFGSLKN